jgi:hypothetical protein
VWRLRVASVKLHESGIYFCGRRGIFLPAYVSSNRVRGVKAFQLWLTGPGPSWRSCRLPVPINPQGFLWGANMLRVRDKKSCCNRMKLRYRSRVPAYLYV